ncbi:MAG: InlB B-repeat-containing protein [bacterium]|nr:InlB B-repeat-containing protein [bacterium]
MAAVFSDGSTEETVSATITVDGIVTLTDTVADENSSEADEGAGDEPETASPEEARRSLGGMLGSSGPIMSAEELFEAVNAASDGDTLTLGADISYDWAVLETMVVSKAITLDFSGYKITTNTGLFDVASGGSLTLVRAQIDSRYEGNNIYGLINEVHGSLIIESTEGNGFDFRSDDSDSVDVVEYNYGQIIIKNGTFYLSYGLVYENHDNASVTIENASVYSEGCVFDAIHDDECYLLIKNGTYQVQYGIIRDLYAGSAVIENGTFITANEECVGMWGGTVTVKGGTFTSEEGYPCFEISGGVLNIEGGTFTSAAETIYAQNAGTEAVLSGGSFTSTSGETALFSEGNAVIRIADGYHTEPEDWQNASEVRVVPDIYTLNFYSEGELYETQIGRLDEIVFPENPNHSQGYTFVFWEDENGNIVEDLSSLSDLPSYEADLYAVFNDRTHTVTFDDRGTTTTQEVPIDTPLGQVPGMDRTDDGDGFYGWKLDNDYIDGSNTSPIYQYGDITLTAVYSSGVVTNYDELMQALADKREAIVLGADIETPDTVAVDYDCTIDGNGFGLIRPVGFEGALLSVKNGVTGGEDDPGVDTDGTTLIARNIYVDGSNLDAYAAAVFVSDGTTLLMDNATVKNNRTTLIDGGAYSNCYDYCYGAGGGIYSEDGANLILNNCTIQNNYATDSGGGIFCTGGGATTLTGCTIKENSVSHETGGGAAFHNIPETAPVIIRNCLIDSNTANCGGGLSFYNSVNDGAFTVNIIDSVISNNTAAERGGALEHTYALVHLYGTTSLEYNKAEEGGAVHSRNGGDRDNTILYMHDNSAICYNEAVGHGGGVYLWEQVLVMYDNSSIHHNRAGGDGGGVSAQAYHIEQYGGVIRDNYAAGIGGGVSNADLDTRFVSGMIFDNRAGIAGDDLFQETCVWSIYASQPSRLYGDGDSLALLTVDVEPIAGYHDVPLNTISVPWYGWFIDGEMKHGSHPAPWDPSISIWGYYVYDENGAPRYTTREESVIISSENENLATFLRGDEYPTGFKAIWYGLVLAYDANFTNDASGTDYQYDTQAYIQNTDAAVLDNMFVRPGYRFTGWNTEADGSGDDYSAEDALLMSKSQVLYAQWEKLPVGDLTVSKTVSGNAADAAKEFTFTVTLSDTTISGTYGDVSFENGIATFTLKGGESKTASSLPNGMGYTVKEADYSSDGYVTTKTGDTGEIVGGETATAAFTNTKNSTPPEDPDDPPVTPETGSLTISKTVTGTAGEKDKLFTFTVTLGAEGSFEYTGSKSGTITSGGTVQLKHGEYITISGIPADTSYMVVESDNSGYEVTKTGDTGTIAADTAATASFTNKKDAAPVTPPDKPDDPGTPETGDNSHMALWISLLLASFGGMIACIVLFRKKRAGI